MLTSEVAIGLQKYEIKKLDSSHTHELSALIDSSDDLYKQKLNFEELKTRKKYLLKILNENPLSTYHGLFIENKLVFAIFGKKYLTVPIYSYGGLISKLDHHYAIRAMDKISYSINQEMRLTGHNSFVTLLRMRAFTKDEAIIETKSTKIIRFVNYLSLKKDYYAEVIRIIKPNERPHEDYVWELMGSRTWDAYLYVMKCSLRSSDEQFPSLVKK